MEDWSQTCDLRKFFPRIARRIHEDENGEVVFRTLLEESGHKDGAEFGLIFKQFFPGAKATQECILKRKETVYRGISVIDKENLRPEEECSLTDLKSYIPSEVMLLPSEEKLTLCVPTNVAANGNRLMKIVKISTTDWELWIRDRKVDLSKMGVDQCLKPSNTSLQTVLTIVDRIPLCKGFPYIETMIIDDMKHIQEKVKIDEEVETEVARSNYCKQVSKWKSQTNVCLSCQRLYSLTKSYEVELDEEDDTDMALLLNKCFPSATSEMKVLLKAQQDMLKHNKQARRWDKRIISICLSMWVRSPHTYQDLIDSNMLILPSGRHLRRTKI